MTWQALVVDDFPMNGCRVHLAERFANMRRYVVQLGPGRDTVMKDQEPECLGPEGMLLPGDAAEALRDALDKYLGRPSVDYQSRYEEARDALEVERRRVDELLARIGAIR